MRAGTTIAMGFLIASLGASHLAAADYVNGYTHVLPSYHLAPPVLYPSPWVMTVPPLIPVYASRPGLVVYEPAFLHTTVMPYDPVVPVLLPGPPVSHVQQRIRSTPRKTEYTVKTFGPTGVTRQEYEIKSTRRGIRVELD